jgi:hypothetical protein
MCHSEMNECRLFLAEIRSVQYIFVQSENKNTTMTEVQISPFLYFKKTVEDRERSFQTSAVHGSQKMI